MIIFNNINELNNLFDQHDIEYKKLIRPPLDEETKILFFLPKLDRIRIISSPIYNFKNIDNLINELYRRYDSRNNILKYINKINIRSNINNINKCKINFNKNKKCDISQNNRNYNIINDNNKL